ncbi:deferrochelatase/peroxidase EfeB [Promicromonospora sp. AC04]|uniref:iron uptake transporter deferrochelatase/peroxidase subunit n=1 Tax=Promicromonospora sp. AC04 TaxID=2135723 RepID=UPI000D3824EC|nr:iron uptake transporter deferrochelatase/peroxidase subunit [Promicromonospora sp. AC04]PUB26233.1 deferrochelatase/peroxidase EfeB [Promicromonospora sp. AC04]
MTAVVPPEPGQAGQEGPLPTAQGPDPLPDGDAAAPDAAPPGARGAVSRRAVLGLALGTAGAAGLAGAAAGRLTAAGQGPLPVGRTEAVPHPFFGQHQAGITTAVQDHLHFVAFDLSERTTREELVALLQEWSYAASRLTQGLDVSASGAVGGLPDAPPDDTGEAIGLSASNLTITFGFGPTLFEKDGTDRFGLADRRPPGLTALPPFVGDRLRAEWSHGDLCMQVCADDPQVAVHAVRNLSRIAFGRAAVRWSQMGFGRTSRTTSGQATPRNLFGFKDGTANILADDAAALADHVWVDAADGPAWLAGGSYLVARKIEMLLETWDRTSLTEQGTTIGRDKAHGAPLSGGGEFTEPDLAAERDGAPVIDVASHVRLAHPTTNGGVRMLRRGYNYVDGTNPLGRLDAGLFFLAYVRDPDRFVTVQKSLATDTLNEYIRHIGSAVFAVPPGTASGGWVGQSLFA